jgi:hypothetical protein
VLVNEHGVEPLKMFLDAGIPNEGMFLNLTKEK